MASEGIAQDDGPYNNLLEDAGELNETFEDHTGLDGLFEDNGELDNLFEDNGELDDLFEDDEDGQDAPERTDSQRQDDATHKITNFVAPLFLPAAQPRPSLSQLLLPQSTSQPQLLLPPSSLSSQATGDSRISLSSDLSYSPVSPSESLTTATSPSINCENTAYLQDASTEAGDENGPDEATVRKTSKPRRTWSEEETRLLIKAVEKHGIGNWSAMARDAEFQFKNRKSIDLKDRFRTCFPVHYKAHANKRDVGNTVDAPILLDLDYDDMKLAKKIKPPRLSKKRVDGGENEELRNLKRKMLRKERLPWVAVDEARLLQGFIKHGSMWASIIKDQVIGLGHRNSDDLRDHFRTIYPDYCMRPEEAKIEAGRLLEMISSRQIATANQSRVNGKVRKGIQTKAFKPSNSNVPSTHTFQVDLLSPNFPSSVHSLGSAQSAGNNECSPTDASFTAEYANNVGLSTQEVEAFASPSPTVSTLNRLPNPPVDCCDTGSPYSFRSEGFKVILYNPEVTDQSSGELKGYDYNKPWYLDVPGTPAFRPSIMITESQVIQSRENGGRNDGYLWCNTSSANYEEVDDQDPQLEFQLDEHSSSSLQSVETAGAATTDLAAMQDSGIFQYAHEISVFDHTDFWNLDLQDLAEVD